MFSSSAPIQLHPHPLLPTVPKSSTQTPHSRENKESQENCFPISLPQQKLVKKPLLWLGARRGLHIF